MNLDNHDIPKHWTPSFRAFLVSASMLEQELTDLIAADSRITADGINVDADAVAQFRQVLKSLFRGIPSTLPDDIYVNSSI